jgi:hypothetical protein
VPKILLGILTLLIRGNKVQLDFNCIAMIEDLSLFVIFNAILYLVDNAIRICLCFVPTISLCYIERLVKQGRENLRSPR